MWTNLKVIADLLTCTKEILNKKIHFLWSDISGQCIYFLHTEYENLRVVTCIVSCNKIFVSWASNRKVNFESIGTLSKELKQPNFPVMVRVLSHPSISNIILHNSTLLITMEINRNEWANENLRNFF